MDTSQRQVLAGKRVVVTGGTGSLGRACVQQMMAGSCGRPEKIIVFSRDEGKHYQMLTEFTQAARATEETIYHNFERLLEFQIGDVRDASAVARVVDGADVVVHAAALKQVPTCEYFPHEAVRTNIDGAHNVVRAISARGSSVQKAVAISTDKACNPVNVMGMTKAIQERIFIEANLRAPATAFLAVRYGNVVASRGSVVPLFQSQIANGGPVTITTREMTRFLITLHDAVETIFAALHGGEPGEIYVPRLPSARMLDLAEVMIGDRPIAIQEVGIRPGEKVHELLISAEEAPRTHQRGAYYVIQPMLPELAQRSAPGPTLTEAFSSERSTAGPAEIMRLLEAAGQAY
ncbi:MAG: polysaccharide biosynthesis protein [Thermomicrobiales bacterium]